MKTKRDPESTGSIFFFTTSKRKVFIFTNTFSMGFSSGDRQAVCIVVTILSGLRNKKDTHSAIQMRNLEDESDVQVTHNNNTITSYTFSV